MPRRCATGSCAPVLFLAYGGAMRWRTKAGDEIAARLGEPLTKDATAHAWRTALDPKEESDPVAPGSGRQAADRGAARRARRRRPRDRVQPDRGPCLRAILEALTGDKPTLVLSDDAGSSARIEEYSASESRWMVAVRMVSEGVDVPRLCVGVYATSTSTPLFFAQAVGRFVRARRRGETASVFLPSVPVILEHAARLEDERDHALDRVAKDDSAASMWAEEDALLDAANRTARTPDIDQMAFEALESDAEFDHVLFDAKQFGLNAVTGSDEEQEYLGLLGCSTRTRWQSCSTNGRPPRPLDGPRVLRRSRSRHTAPSQPSGRSSTSWLPPMPARRAPRTVSCTTSCGGPAEDPPSRRPPPSRSSLGSRRSGPGSSDVADRRLSFFPDLSLLRRPLDKAPWNRACPRRSQRRGHARRLGSVTPCCGRGGRDAESVCLGALWVVPLWHASSRRLSIVA